MKKPKPNYRIKRYSGVIRTKLDLDKWIIQMQVKPGGKWFNMEEECALGHYKTIYHNENQARLKMFALQQGPRFERWFKENYTEL